MRGVTTVLAPLALHPHDHPQRAVFSPDGARFLVADDARLVAYDRDGVALVAIALTRTRIAPHVFGLAWSPDGAYVATVEYAGLRLRRASDLAVIAETTLGRGPVAFCMNGTRLAVASHSRLHILAVPSLADLGSLKLEWGDFQSFAIEEVVADPAGGFVAATDYGGWSEDDWGHTAERGEPKLTIVDATAPGTAVRSLTQNQPITALELDLVRRRLLVGNYHEVLVRDLATTPLVTWSAYGSTTIRALAVCEHYVATLPDITMGRTPLSIDLWDPESYTRRAHVPFLADTPRATLLAMRPWWLAPSPDGSRLVTHEPGGVRVFAVKRA